MRAFKLLIFIIILASVFNSCQSPLGNSFEKQFVITDTLSIQNIKISGDNELILNRVVNGWKLNDGSPVNQVAINNLLLSFTRMEKMGVSNNFEASGSVNIQFTIETFKKSYFLSLYFIDNEAYIGNMESNDVFRIGIKGLPDIKLSDVFSDSEAHWKKPMLIDFNRADIKEIITIPKLSWGDEFKLRNTGGEWSLFDGSGTEVNEDSIDKAKLADYSRNFVEIYYKQEIIDNDFYEKVILKEVFFTIRIKTELDEGFRLSIYPNHNEEGYYDDFYALVTKSDSKSIYLVNYVFLDPMFESYSSFLKK